MRTAIIIMDTFAIAVCIHNALTGPSCAKWAWACAAGWATTALFQFLRERARSLR